MNKGDILLTKTNSHFGHVVEKYTNSYWTHVNLLKSDDETFEFAFNRRAILTLEQLFKEDEIIEYKVIEGVANNREIKEVEKLFRHSAYENLQGLYRIMRKVQRGRDGDNIQSGAYTFTCSSLPGKVLEDRLPIGIHYSQILPDDYEVIER